MVRPDGKLRLVEAAEAEAEELTARLGSLLDGLVHAGEEGRAPKLTLDSLC